MARSLRIIQAAENDLEEAFHWYERRRHRLGHELLDAVDECFLRVVGNPLAFQKVHRSVRRALVRRFPYCVYFVDNEPEVVVLAVLHGRQSATHWQERI